MSDMELTHDEQAMLRGDHGDTVREALALQVEVGRFFGAKRFVPVTNAHMMGDIEVMGDGGLEWLRRAATSQTRCALPVTTNARCMDPAFVHVLGQDVGEVVKERELIGLLQSMDVTTTDTCINYQTAYQPHFGERIAWGDTGAVIYANSVLGARSNFEAGPAALAAAITRRVPEYGFHLDDHRRGTFVVNVDATLDDVADWGALGKLVGEARSGYFQVPVFTGLQTDPTADELKHLGAALASFGTMAMFHIVGITPEAPSVAAACGPGRRDEPVTITQADLENVYDSYLAEPARCDLVVFSGPQLSLWELKRLSERFAAGDAKCVAKVFVTTEAGTLANARRLGYAATLREAGVALMAGVCFYILLNLSEIRTRNAWTTLVTNSAKLTNVIGAHGFQTVLRRTDACVAAAISGEIR